MHEPNIVALSLRVQRTGRCRSGAGPGLLRYRACPLAVSRAYIGETQPAGLAAEASAR